MINRNNYEAYFLLLADNELSPAEEATVKQFAAKHPDLQEELDMLLSCRLDAEPMPVFPKEKLLRTTLWDTENPEPVHTQMLLLLDGELLPAQSQQLQKQIAASTTLQAEWNSLQQVRLVAEPIAHPAKETLHRTQRKVRPLLWMRWAAAAAVAAGLGWLLLMQQLPQATPASPTLAAAPTLTKTPLSTAQNQNSISTQSKASLSTGKPAETTVATATPIKKATITNQPAKERASNEQTATVSKEASPMDDTHYAQLIPAEPAPVLATLNSADVQLTTANRPNNNATQVAHLTAKPIAVSILAPSHSQDAFAGKKEPLAGEEDTYVTVGGAHINKQKMRGLFRNVTRSVARTFSKSKLEPDVYATR